MKRMKEADMKERQKNFYKTNYSNNNKNLESINVGTLFRIVLVIFQFEVMEMFLKRE